METRSDCAVAENVFSSLFFIFVSHLWNLPYSTIRYTVRMYLYIYTWTFSQIICNTISSVCNIISKLAREKDDESRERKKNENKIKSEWKRKKKQWNKRTNEISWKESWNRIKDEMVWNQHTYLVSRRCHLRANHQIPCGVVAAAEIRRKINERKIKDEKRETMHTGHI